MFRTYTFDRLSLPLWLASLVLLVPFPLYGSGFGVFTQGASALGQSNAVVSHHDTPSAIFFNPALITNIPGTQAEWGSTGVLARREFKSDFTGSKTDSDDSLEIPSHFYLTHGVNEELSLGLGLFFPFGLTTHWPDDWDGRYLATESQIITVDINPVIAYNVTPRITVAAGISYLYLDALLKNNINLTDLTGSAFGPLADGKQKLTGDGDGWGYNAGLAVKLTDDIVFGASYRSQIHVDIDGDVDFRLPDLSPAAGAALYPLFADSEAKTDLTLPQQLCFGLSYSGIDRLTIEMGARWEDWRSYDELVIKLGDGTISRRETDWRDTWSYNVGARYSMGEGLVLLGGYMYGQDAVPDRSFEPSVPDSDFHLFTVGSELQINKNWSFDMAYGLELHENRHKENAVGLLVGGAANGDYDQRIHLFAGSLRYRF
ncbi:MAG: OmpP1/FadL family transporter [bacterium]|nr:OmpP1/FadL family transporter [bacterium]